MAAAMRSPSDVHFVQVKGPAFTQADIAAAEAGATPASDNPGKLMGFGRAASAIGVGQALGEIPADRARKARSSRISACSLQSRVAPPESRFVPTR